MKTKNPYKKYSGCILDPGDKTILATLELCCYACIVGIITQRPNVEVVQFGALFGLILNIHLHLLLEWKKNDKEVGARDD